MLVRINIQAAKSSSKYSKIDLSESLIEKHLPVLLVSAIREGEEANKEGSVVLVVSFGTKVVEHQVAAVLVVVYVLEQLLLFTALYYRLDYFLGLFLLNFLCLFDSSTVKRRPETRSGSECPSTFDYCG